VIRISADKIYHKCEAMRMQDRHNAFFAGFAPVRDPKIAVAVLVEHGCHGASAAGPVARAVIKTYLQKYYPELYSDKAVALRMRKRAKNTSGDESRIERRRRYRAQRRRHAADS